MKVVGTVFAAAVAAGVLSACSSGPSCRYDDCCRQVWVPPHCETKVGYCVEPAKTHTRPLPVMGLCRKSTWECVPEIRKAPVEVADYCERRVPTYEPDCVPVNGYRRVQDCRDILVPVCEKHCVEETEQVEVPDYGWCFDRCGLRQRIQTGCHTETRTCGQHSVTEQVGERLVSIQAGSHLGECQRTQKNVCVPVGERVATFKTGMHIEQRPVWRDCKCVETGSEIRAVETGTRCDTVEKMPWRYEAQEQDVQVPGFCATVCNDPKHHHRGIVLTEAEYQEYLIAAKR